MKLLIEKKHCNLIKEHATRVDLGHKEVIYLGEKKVDDLLQRDKISCSMEREKKLTLDWKICYLTLDWKICYPDPFSVKIIQMIYWFV